MEDCERIKERPGMIGWYEKWNEIKFNGMRSDGSMKSIKEVTMTTLLLLLLKKIEIHKNNNTINK